MRPFGEPDEIVEIVLAQRDGVDLDLEAGGDGGVDPLDDLVEPPAARDPGVGFGVEAVQRDVDPPDAAAGEIGGMLGQPGAVGGQGQLVEVARAPGSATARRSDR